MFVKEKSNDTITLEEKSSNTGREATKLEPKRYHQWANNKGQLVCSGCGTKGNELGIAGIDQNCIGNLFETIVSETTLQQSEALQLATQEA